MKDKKQGTGHTVLTLSILVVLGIFLVSAGLLCRSLYEYRKGEKEYGLLQRYAAKAPGREPESRSPYSLSAGEQEPMLAVDFEALKKLNPHIIAWIHIPGTPVSYPVTQGAVSYTHLDVYKRQIEDQRYQNAEYQFHFTMEIVQSSDDWNVSRKAVQRLFDRDISVTPDNWDGDKYGCSINWNSDSGKN